LFYLRRNPSVTARTRFFIRDWRIVANCLVDFPSRTERRTPRIND
jgi:hypothetical protein